MAKELTHKGLRPAIHSRVWFIWHLEARLEYLRDKRAELADAIVAQHDVLVDHDWAADEMRKMDRLRKQLLAAAYFSARVEEDLAALYVGAGEDKGWPLADEVVGL